MITATQIRKAEAAVTYFGRELGTSDYYLAEKGVWYGKGARILGLAPEVSKEDFVAIVNNQAPGSGNGSPPGTTPPGLESCGSWTR